MYLRKEYFYMLFATVITCKKYFSRHFVFQNENSQLINYTKTKKINLTKFGMRTHTLYKKILEQI